MESQCFICLRSTHLPTCESTRSQIFNYFCDLLDVPWVKKEHGFETVNFCKVCTLQLEKATEIDKSIKVLQCLRDLIKRQLRMVILKANIRGPSNNEIENLSAATQFGRMLAQCWSQCQVRVPALKGISRGQLDVNPTEDSANISDAEDKVEADLLLSSSSPGESQVGKDSSRMLEDEDSMTSVDPEEDVTRSDLAESNQVTPCDLVEAILGAPGDLSGESHMTSCESVEDTLHDLGKPKEVVRSSLKSVGVPRRRIKRKRSDCQRNLANLECKYCKKTFNRSSDHTAHMRQHGEGKDENMKCKDCGVDFRSERIMFRQKESEAPKFRCDFSDCDLIFDDLSKAKRHHRKKCEAKMVKDAARVPDHLPCDYCQKIFIRKRDLTVHINREHRESETATNPACRCGLDYFSCLVEITGQYKCPAEDCRQIFATLHELRKHHRTKCESYKVAAQTESTGYLCHLCGLDLKSCRVQDLPSDSREELFLCSFKDCKKQFESFAKFRKHHTSHLCKPRRLKPDAERIPCDKCEKTFKTRSSLRDHKIGVHDRVKRYICDECGAGYYDKSKLEYHIMYKHKKEKKFVCHVCGKAFKIKPQLDIHFKKHTDKFEYICESCGKGFHTMGRLNTHKNTIHSEQPVPCPHCAKMYRSEMHVGRHMMHKHKRKWSDWVAKLKGRQAKAVAMEQQEQTESRNRL